MPAAAVAMRTPAISGISGKFEGASGDTAGAMGILQIDFEKVKRRLTYHPQLDARRRGSGHRGRLGTHKRNALYAAVRRPSLTVTSPALSAVLAPILISM